MMAAKNRLRGFTLLEIIVVLIVIGVLAALGLPGFMTVVERMRAKEGEQVLLTLLAAQKRYFLENHGYSASLGQLDVDLRRLAYFGNVTVYDSASAVAEVTRAGLLYKLKISDTAGISCSEGPPGLCSKIGY